jgi:tripartite-type tricarboxylate transporter receptor subunit TctC
MNRRSFLSSVVLFVATAGQAKADQWPARPITMIVPLAAGSTSDIFARIVGTELGNALGAQFVVENRPGGGGNIGVEMAAHAAPDGYTIVVGTNAQLAINVGLFASLPFDPLKDFTPVMPMAESFNGLIVPNESPAHSVDELVRLAKSKPGVLNYASGGIGSTQHLSAALFCSQAGIEAVHVPYKGAPEGVNAVMSNEVAFGFFNLPNVVPLAKSGQLRVLAVTGARRSNLLPDTPTMQDVGFTNYETNVWFGLYLPSGVPEPILEKLRLAAGELMRRPAFATRMQEIGFEVMPIRTPAESSAFLDAEIAKWVAIVKLSGAKAD